MKPPRDYGPDEDNPWDPSVAKQEAMWEKDGVVWDPEALSWRPPRPGEIPPPPDAPEKPPSYQQQQPRDKTPVACLELYDHYVRAQSRALELQAEINAASERYWEAQRRHNATLAKFTLTLGWDVGSLLGAGVSGVHDVAAITRPAGLGPADAWSPTGAMGRALEAAKVKLTALLARIRQLTNELVELGGRVSRARQTMENLTRSAASLWRKVDDLKQALAAAERRVADLDGKVAKAAERVTQAREAHARATGRVSGLQQRIERLEATRPHCDRWSKAWDRVLDLEQKFKTAHKELDSLRQGKQAKLDTLETEWKRLAQLREEALEAGETVRAGQLQQQMRQLDEAQDQVRQAVHNARGRAKSIDDQLPPAWQARDEAEAALKPFQDLDPREIPARQKQLDEARQAAGAAQRQVDEALQAEQAVRTEVQPLQQEVQQHREAVSSATRRAEAEQQQVRDAATALQEAEAARNAKEAEIRQVERQAVEAEMEVNRLSSQHAMDPGTIGSIVQGLKDVVIWAGKTWEWLFGGQSPEEVASILLEARNNVQQRLDELRAKQAEYDQTTSDLRTIKPQLDRCIEQHTPYTGSGGS